MHISMKSLLRLLFLMGLILLIAVSCGDSKSISETDILATAEAKVRAEFTSTAAAWTNTPTPTDIKTATPTLTLTVTCTPTRSVSPTNVPTDTPTLTPSPTEIIVNTILDDPRGCPQNCTLRSAITIAKPGDVIVFEPGLVGTIELVQSLVIDKDLDIVGPGPELLKLDGGGKLRLFLIEPEVSVSISGLTIQHGYVSGERGGGIYNLGTMTIQNSIVAYNSADEGGGIYNAQGTLIINNSIFEGNRQDTSNGSGAGIYNNAGHLSIDGSTFNNNVSRDNNGAAVTNKNGTASILDSTFTNNHSRGGTICNLEGNLDVANSLFTDNSADSDCSGIFHYIGLLTITNSVFERNTGTSIVIAGGEASIVNSTLRQNSANSRGGGLTIESSGIVTVHGSTFDRNVAGTSDQGGAVYNKGQTAIINSTFVNNSAGAGGAIWNTGRLVVSHATISGNQASRGGGIAGSGTISLGSSIVYGNTADQSPDIFGDVASQSFNIVGNAEGANGLWPSDINSGSPMLSQLSDNGGPTQTMALQQNSPAIDAIPEDSCTWDPDNNPNTSAEPVSSDQRGVARVGQCDIGAFEFGLIEVTAEESDGTEVVPQVGSG